MLSLEELNIEMARFMGDLVVHITKETSVSTKTMGMCRVEPGYYIDNSKSKGGYFPFGGIPPYCYSPVASSWVKQKMLQDFGIKIQSTEPKEVCLEVFQTLERDF